MHRNYLRAGSKELRLILGLSVALMSALAVAACGKTSSTGSSAGASTGSSSTPSQAVASTANGCGTVPTVADKDESGLLSRLGSTVTSQFNGYSTPIFKSAYANFKPSGKPPYTIGISVTQPISPTQAALVPMLQSELKTIPGVGKVVLLTSPPTGLTTQLQQAHSLVQQHVNFIVAEPLVPQAFIPIAAAARAAGIPFISLINTTPSADSINIAPNSVGDALTSGAALMKAIGGKGIVLGVHGVSSTGVDQASFKGWSTVFAKCPGVTFNTSIQGEFQPSVAKAATLAYLSSHPQPVAGVVETAGMSSGILQAFQQTGRPIPKFVDAGPSIGELAYFKAHPSQLVSAPTVTPSGLVTAAKYTIEQLIAGRGPKISELASLSTVIDGANLSQFIPANAPLSDEAIVEGTWDPPSYLARLFNK